MRADHAAALLSQAAGIVGDASARDRVEAISTRARERLLEVAVVGEFKRGKSTLVNALIERDVLPTGVLPLTAVPTVIEPGDEGCEVRFASGALEHHPLSEVARFVAEEGNPGNRLGVAVVTVRLHTPLLDEGVRLTDTPGIGSVLEHGTEATTAYLPNVDAAILVTAADPPISREETAFLDRVMEHAVRLFVVLNKADHLDPHELERARAFTEAVVRRHVADQDVKVYALSARSDRGDPSALASFRSDLKRFLVHEREATARASAHRGLRQVADGLRLAMDMEREALDMDAGRLAEATRAFEEARRRLAERTETDSARLEGARRAALRAYDDAVEAAAGEVTAEVRRRTDERIFALAGSSPVEMIETLRAERVDLLNDIAGPVGERAAAEALVTFARGAQDTARDVAGRLESLARSAAGSFGVELPDLTLDVPEPEVTKPAFTYVRPLALGDQAVFASWRLLGGRGVRRVRARALEEADEETAMYFGRLRGALGQQLSDDARRFAAALRRLQEGLECPLTEAVERATAAAAGSACRREERAAELQRAAGLVEEALAGLSDA